MTRTLFVGAALLFVARSGSAQNPLASAKGSAQRAASATTAHVEAEQRPDAQPQSPRMTRTVASTRQSGVNALNVVQSDTTGSSTTIMRETYDYVGGGRRDPFFSLLSTNELRPAMSDLRLTGILFDHSTGHSVATLRDLGTNAQYRVTVGSALGRMRVSSIRIKSVVFTIDEFGSNRLDSLVLGDTTKARGK